MERLWNPSSSEFLTNHPSSTQGVLSPNDEKKLRREEPPQPPTLKKTFFMVHMVNDFEILKTNNYLKSFTKDYD